jgi:hypothetical protein
MLVGGARTATGDRMPVGEADWRSDPRFVCWTRFRKERGERREVKGKREEGGGG